MTALRPSDFAQLIAHNVMCPGFANLIGNMLSNSSVSSKHLKSLAKGNGNFFVEYARGNNYKLGTIEQIQDGIKGDTFQKLMMRMREADATVMGIKRLKKDSTSIEPEYDYIVNPKMGDVLLDDDEIYVISPELKKFKKKIQKQGVPQMAKNITVDTNSPKDATMIDKRWQGIMDQPSMLDVYLAGKKPIVGRGRHVSVFDRDMADEKKAVEKQYDHMLLDDSKIPTLAEATIKNVRQLKIARNTKGKEWFGHIILTGDVNTCSILGDLIFHLRRDYHTIFPIIILAPEPPNETLWNQFFCFPKIHYIKGSCENETDLQRAGIDDKVSHDTRVVILTRWEDPFKENKMFKRTDEGASLDPIPIYKNVLKMFQDESGKLSEGTEFNSNVQVAFGKGWTPKNAKKPTLKHQEKAALQSPAYIGSSAIYFDLLNHWLVKNEDLIHIVREFMSSAVLSLPVNDTGAISEGKMFGEIFKDSFLHNGRLPLGVQRKMPNLVDCALRDEIFQYSIASPRKNLKLQKSDAVIMLLNTTDKARDIVILTKPIRVPVVNTSFEWDMEQDDSNAASAPGNSTVGAEENLSDGASSSSETCSSEVGRSPKNGTRHVRKRSNTGDIQSISTRNKLTQSQGDSPASEKRRNRSSSGSKDTKKFLASPNDSDKTKRSSSHKHRAKSSRERQKERERQKRKDRAAKHRKKVGEALDLGHRQKVKKLVIVPIPKSGGPKRPVSARGPSSSRSQNNSGMSEEEKRVAMRSKIKSKSTRIAHTT
eukprot:TRINITY_DN3459_c0_g3_i1.p1 TRINITY_DN3459_c0_g3~~TRINITY_DN3459_c0_g3_i1.p1  ORF type:complete len:765 (+),score=117.77 TRINITY_DN3459_c0_g3_i1:1332-3626(+)